MNIKNELLKEHSRLQTTKVINYLRENKDSFSEVMELFLGTDKILNQRAAWVIGDFGVEHPDFIKTWLEKIINKASEARVHDAVKRHAMRIIEKASIPDELLGHAAELAFNFMSDHSTPIAIKALSMSVLYKICLKEPGLKNEVVMLIEDNLPYSAPGIRVRAKKILMQLADI